MVDLHLFFFASLMLIITPGNDMVFVATQSVHGGAKKGMIASAGVGLGSLTHTIVAALGLSALLKTLPVMFLSIKIAGACYLFYLGGKMLLQKKQDSLLATKGIKSNYKVLQQGLLTNLLNPKVALFYLAFLPQFVSPNAPHYAYNILFLGVLFDVMASAFNLTISELFGRFGNWLQDSPRFHKWQAKITGSIFMFLGANVLLQKSN